MAASTCGDGHQDAVNSVAWLPNSGAFPTGSHVAEEYHLVSFGSDGRVICWTLQIAPSRGQTETKLSVVKM